MFELQGRVRVGSVCVCALCHNICDLSSEPSVEVFQPSNKEGFSLGLQLKK